MGCKFENWLDASVALKYLRIYYCCIICVVSSQDIGSSSSVCRPAARGLQAREKGEDLQRWGGGYFGDDGVHMYKCEMVHI